VKHALWRYPRVALASPAIIGALVVASAGAVPLQQFDGYRKAADAMPYADDGSLILIAVQHNGEGALISERLSHERLHKDVILRASHVLVQLDSAGNCRPLFKSADAIRNYLLQMPVRFVILGNPPAPCKYNEWMDKAVAEDPVDFHLIAAVPIFARQQGQVDLLRIYENPSGRTRHPSIVRTPMGLDAGGRMLEYRWQ
jgi:hypothetical protein